MLQKQRGRISKPISLDADGCNNVGTTSRRIDIDETMLKVLVIGY